MLPRTDGKAIRWPHTRRQCSTTNKIGWAQAQWGAGATRRTKRRSRGPGSRQTRKRLHNRNGRACTSPSVTQGAAPGKPVDGYGAATDKHRTPREATREMWGRSQPRALPQTSRRAAEGQALVYDTRSHRRHKGRPQALYSPLCYNEHFVTAVTDCKLHLVPERSEVLNWFTDGYRPKRS